MPAIDFWRAPHQPEQLWRGIYQQLYHLPLSHCPASRQIPVRNPLERARHNTLTQLEQYSANGLFMFQLQSPWKKASLHRPEHSPLEGPQHSLDWRPSLQQEETVYYFWKQLQEYIPLSSIFTDSYLLGEAGSVSAPTSADSSSAQSLLPPPGALRTPNLQAVLRVLAPRLPHPQDRHIQQDWTAKTPSNIYPKTIRYARKSSFPTRNHNDQTYYKPSPLQLPMADPQPFRHRPSDRALPSLGFRQGRTLGGQTVIYSDTHAERYAVGCFGDVGRGSSAVRGTKTYGVSNRMWASEDTS